MQVVKREAGERWTRADKERAACALVATGSQKQAAEQTGIPRTTISSWITQSDEDFQKVLDAARAEYEATAPDRLAYGMDLAFEQLLSDVGNLNALNAAKVYGILFDKRQIMLSRPTSISGKSEDVEKKLEDLKAKFEQFVKPKSVA